MNLLFLTIYKNFEFPTAKTSVETTLNEITFKNLFAGFDTFSIIVTDKFGLFLADYLFTNINRLGFNVKLKFFICGDFFKELSELQKRLYDKIFNFSDCKFLNRAEEISNTFFAETVKAEKIIYFLPKNGKEKSSCFSRNDKKIIVIRI